MRHSRRNSSLRKKIGLLILLLLVVMAGFIGYKILKYAPVLYGIGFNKGIALHQTQQRVNILLLGIGGGTHEGPDLTDTIIFASVDPEAKKITLVSIPRDLWIPDLKGKINSAYTIGEDKEKGGGLILTKAVVSKVVGQKIDYGIRVDFDGFVKAVDMVGGLDINVDRTFDDYAYPVTGKEEDTCGFSQDQIASMSAQIASGSASETELFPCRYEHLHFDKGLTHMDGETALKYVRSRHALGVEGTDFARSQRQQKVITAFRAKIFSVGTFLNPVKLVSLYDVFKASIDTDIKQDEYDDFVRLAEKMQHAKIQSVVIDTGDTDTGRPGLVMNPAPSAEYGYAWMLLPTAGSDDYSQIQNYVACEIKYAECDVETGKPILPSPTPAPSAVVTPTK